MACSPLFKRDAEGDFLDFSGQLRLNSLLISRQRVEKLASSLGSVQIQWR